MIKLLILLAVLTQSCATIIKGTRQHLAINSNPQNAQIIINGMDYGRTPAYIPIHKDEKFYTVTIQKEGFAPQTIYLQKKLENWVWGNIIFGGLIGLLVDYTTGAMYKLTPSQINVQLSQGVAFNEIKVDGSKKSVFIFAGLVNDDSGLEKIGNISQQNA